MCAHFISFMRSEYPRLAPARLRPYNCLQHEYRLVFHQSRSVTVLATSIGVRWLVAPVYCALMALLSTALMSKYLRFLFFVWLLPAATCAVRVHKCVLTSHHIFNHKLVDICDVNRMPFAIIPHRHSPSRTHRWSGAHMKNGNRREKKFCFRIFFFSFLIQWKAK